MKKTKTTGQQCVGQVRLCPIDVGFDLRYVAKDISLPDNFTSVGLAIGDDTFLLEGTTEELRAAITEAGYSLSAE